MLLIKLTFRCYFNSIIARMLFNYISYVVNIIFQSFCGTNSILVFIIRCACENCLVMGRVEACKCCREIEQVKSKLTEAVTCGECTEEPTCITQHPGFHPVCINRWVLQTAWFQYKQQYKDTYDGPEHKLFRHIAYRQLARWCWGILGKEIGVVLPSCAVMCIRPCFYGLGYPRQPSPRATLAELTFHLFL